jgi:nitroreductase
MDVKEAINKRRAFRALEKIEISDSLIKELAKNGSLSPSCFNKQPWRFVFVKDEEKLKNLYTSLSKGNEWAYNSSMIIAVISERKLDCIVEGREYYLFDTGMATAFIILRATELGLVAHPIAGFDEDKAKNILNIPEEMQLITMIITGKKSEKINPELSDYQEKSEKKRPERLSFEQFASIDEYRL